MIGSARAPLDDTPSGVRRDRRWSAKPGLTLIELLIAMVLGLVVVVPLMAFVIVSLRQQNTISSCAFASRQAEAGMALLTGDLRQAQDVVSSAGTIPTPTTVSLGGGSTSVSFYRPPAGGAYTPGTQVTWTCTAGGCTRTGSERSCAAGSPCTATNPAYVAIFLQVADLSQSNSDGGTVAGGQNPITLQDGVGLRSY